MGKSLFILLTPDAREELVLIRDHDPKPYMRERAAAILKIAQGHTGKEVAEAGLLRSRAPVTVRDWAARFKALGIEGLRIKPGRGRKPAFSPCVSRPRGGQVQSPDDGPAGP